MLRIEMKALVAGTGIGGLSNALRLIRRGFEVEMAEQFFQPVGRMYQVLLKIEKLNPAEILTRRTRITNRQKMLLLVIIYPFYAGDYLKGPEKANQRS